MSHLGPAPDPSTDRRFLVMPEIGATPTLQELKDMTLGVSGAGILLVPIGMRQRFAAQNALEETRQHLRRGGAVRQISFDDGTRHTIEPRRVRLLR
ncbi:MAG: hypothetical protein WAK69_00390 [Rhodoplanes sp.]